MILFFFQRLMEFDNVVKLIFLFFSTIIVIKRNTFIFRTEDIMFFFSIICKVTDIISND